MFVVNLWSRLEEMLFEYPSEAEYNNAVCDTWTYTMRSCNRYHVLLLIYASFEFSRIHFAVLLRFYGSRFQSTPEIVPLRGGYCGSESGDL